MKKFDFTRFHKAQEADFAAALSEIEKGRKRSHWMWYIFPQIKGLGYSQTARYYGIDGIEEAKAYLADQKLKDHLTEICEALLKLGSNDADSIFGYPDNLKLKSSMTLFAAAAADMEVFDRVLAKFFGGEKDQKTLAILNSAQS